MPKRKGIPASSDAEDEQPEEEQEEAAPSTDKTTTTSDGSRVVCELSRNRKVAVKKFKGKVFVDVREFWSKDGEDLPSKKGISLPLEQWEMLREHIEDVREVIASFT
ncbi:unnamed protein product [Sphagnum troendelagicum]